MGLMIAICCLIFSDSQCRADVTAVILFHLRGEQLGAPWFLNAGFNHILKTLIDKISKTSRETPKTTGICCRKQLFLRLFYVSPAEFGRILGGPGTLF